MSGDHHNTDDSKPRARVKALEAILTEKGLIDPAAIDAIVDLYETRVGPRNGGARRRESVDRPRLSQTPARRRDQGGGGTWPRRSRGRASGRRREY